MAKMLDNRGTTSKIFQIGRETALKSTDDSLEVVSAQFPAERKDFRASTATFEGLVLPNALLNATDNRFTKNPISNGYELVNGDKRTTLTVDQETGTVESSDGFGIKHSGYVSNAILGFKAPASVSGMKITMPAGFNVNYSDGRDLYDENNNPNGKGGLKSYNSITDAEYTVTVAPTGEDVTVSYHALFDETAKELFYVSKDQLYYGIKVPTAEDGYLVRRDSNGNDYYRLIDGVWVKRHIIRVASFDLTDGKTMDNFEPCYPCDLLKLTDYLVADSGGSGGGSQQATVRSMEIPASDSETVSIALDYACYDKNAMLVLIEHTVVPPATYEISTNGKTLTFNTPIPAGMRIDLRWFSNIEVIKVDIPLASDTEFMQGTSDVLAPTVKQVHQYNGTKLPLFYPSRFPWVANNIEWLRADTFSWQSGEVYSAAYAELVSIYNAEGGANETETIGAYTITYKRCANGMKIADASQQNVIMNIYAATGSAFYFILDLGNSRFKLPRTKYSLVGYEDGLGNYVSSEAATGNGVKVAGIQSYLYFYMGTYNQSAIDNTAGLNTELFAGKADVDYVQNKFDAKANRGLDNSPYTTNRILEIPQDIKLELNNGTLTLKAGSKVYVPNGFKADGTTPKFDEVVISSDLTNTTTANTQLALTVYRNKLSPFLLSQCFSGGSAPTSPTAGTLWYDTANNKMKVYANSIWNERNDCLPIAILTANGTSYTSIDQVFNGFGYIGSTAFALPGVKVQIPNGRNEDGSCKNLLYTETSVKTFTSRSDWGAGVFHAYIGDTTEYDGSQYDFFPTADSVTKPSEKNLYFDTVTGRYNSWCPVVSLYWDSTGKITSFSPFIVDSVVNSNASNFSQAGRSYLSGLGMPSSRYIDLTLGASGSTYTAPANGYFVVTATSTSASRAFVVLEKSHGICNGDHSYSAETGLRCFVPCQKGKSTSLIYGGATITSLWFVYAEGENS